MTTLEEMKKAHVETAFTEDSLALSFAEHHASDMRYVTTWGRWFIWDGTRWIRDDTQLATDKSRELCRAAAQSTNKLKTAQSLASRRVISNVESLSQSDRKIATTIDQWDADGWLLNTPGGTVNLKTGASKAHDREDFITKSTAVAPRDSCPLWESFITRVTGGNAELATFLQRVSGYSLTGDTTEHALFFLYGEGGNGKGVFLNTIAGIMGDYALTASMDAFVVTHNDRHPTELAAMRGARLVTAQETEEGRRWAESKIKALTGGDKISARFMRQDFFEFTPQFKLVIAGNFKPALRGVNEAIRRRMNLVPFTMKIAESERDPQLAEKLRAEWPGILAWMIRGCVEWQDAGLRQPGAVLEATQEYLAEEDSTSAWFDELCVRDANAKTLGAAAWGSWVRWAEGAGVFVGDRKRFYRTMDAMGFQRGIREGAPLFRGFSIRNWMPEGNEY